MSTYRIAIFASGNGSNAQYIAEHFALHKQISVVLILTNNPQAGVIGRAEKLNIPILLFNRQDFYESDLILDQLIKERIDLVVLAGFLWKVPSIIIEKYPDKIINIHPALLPKYGGKGMYGKRVHLAVKENKEEESGISIHLVNEHYDEGRIIFQAKCKIDAESDTAEDIAEKVHALEYAHFPQVIEQWLLSNKSF
ncbi:MAG: phosphoribosylglycinamide formyltransferase [Bacteroidetes bacterium]|nr:phosphoribosylglycinamide formyltransferase [Bacteroidota bacterium]MBL6964146.1 phosphoribosylglycinamide formyltransferase [Bacteroidota bacterium]